MRKMWVSKIAYEVIDECPSLELNFEGHPDTEQEVYIFTPEELEAHERKVWEAAREEQDIDEKTVEYKYCYFENWEQEE